MTTEAQKQEEAAILDVVKGVYQAWNNADPDAFVAEYFDDASAILPGSYLKSRQEIHDAMAFSFSGPLKGTRTSDNVLDVRFLNDEAAVVISETGVLIPGETQAPPERTVYATWVLAKKDGKWQLAAYSNSPSVAPGRS
ncbi:SgcJ/EcaC family oxidoreductase [Streptomyces sp. NPDC051104]|uniref:SgcJ/EcaC family oxidoreductase n=1 Tax=Streptomyces sp. NPDC051104 TaxID=3155044 RepID=UPI00341FBF85